MSKNNGHRPRSAATRIKVKADECPLSGPNGDQYLGAVLAVVSHYHAAHDDSKLSVFGSLDAGLAPDTTPLPLPVMGVIIVTNDPEWTRKLLEFIKPADDEIKEALKEKGTGTGTDGA